MTSPAPSRVLIILAFAAVYLVWGSTYLGIRYAIETLPPFLMTGTRFSIAGAILLTWALIRGETIRSSLSQWPKALAIGALLLLCGNGGVTWAEKYIASGFAALLVATEPLWVVVLNWGLSHKRPNWKVLLGVFIGMVGVALLVGDRLKGGISVDSMSLIGAVVVLFAGFAWAAGSVFASRHPIKTSTWMASGMQMLSGGILLLLLGLVTGDPQRLDLARASWLSIGAFFYLLVFGSLVGFTAYSWLLRNVSPARAATYAYVNPVVAVLLGWFLANEPITLRMIIGAAVIIGSVALITTFSKEHTGPTAAAPNSVHDSECPTYPCA
jgi:drug/metabolite transporter (DMT)-like permease